ncbi:MAG TPA: ABC transporter permease [Candidatus Polarisedimenticolia bacterium]|nr:ABC transporter permease [Candidatus Polarisedimenticolia bacterium]
MTAGAARKAWAFVWKDFLIEVSYKSAFILHLGGVIFSVGLWFFFSGFLQENLKESMDALTGGNLFAFILFGVAPYSYQQVSLTAFGHRFREEQVTGTLEAMLVCPTRTPLVIFGSALFDFLFTSFRVVLYVLVGIVFSRFTARPIVLHWEGAGAAILIFTLMVATSVGIGIMAAAFVMYFKKGEVLVTLISSASGLLGGVFFPTGALPDSIQPFSRLLPISYTTDGVRRALLTGEGIPALLPHIQVLFVFAAVLLPLGLFVFRAALRGARRDGTLVQY